MKVKIFDNSWSDSVSSFEKEINDFLATLRPGAVKHVHTALAATRTGEETDQMEEAYIVSVWYEE